MKGNPYPQEMIDAARDLYHAPGINGSRAHTNTGIEKILRQRFPGQRTPTYVTIANWAQKHRWDFPPMSPETEKETIVTTRQIQTTVPSATEPTRDDALKWAFKELLATQKINEQLKSDLAQARAAIAKLESDLQAANQILEELNTPKFDSEEVQLMRETGFLQPAGR